MTAKKIIEQIELRMGSLQNRIVVLQKNRADLRYKKPWVNMTTRELDSLPSTSKFWVEDNKYSDKIMGIESELSGLREMLCAYENFGGKS